MCGRAILTATADVLKGYFGLDDVPDLTARYNIAPTQPIAVVRHAGRLELLRWGIPAASEGARGQRINVRGESVATAYREAFRARRCLVVVDGFYEWQRANHEGHARGKPFVVRREKGEPFALAGIWERRVTVDGEVQETCAVVTEPSRGVVAPIHDRMPVIVPREAFTRWLSGSAGEARGVLESLALREVPLVSYEVSTRVNAPANDDAKCLEPAPADPRGGNLTLFD
jgi:putative SOS response-associated peptidase YedK